MEVSEALLIMFTFLQEYKCQKELKRAINIYCRNGENINFGETDARYQRLLKKKKASRNMISLQRNYFKWDKRGIFFHISCTGIRVKSGVSSVIFQVWAIRANDIKSLIMSTKI